MKNWILLPILFLLGGCLLIPDDQEKGTRVQNLRPLVQITAGAATSDSAGIDYKVNFQWRGADEDGVVIRFEYAMDDTTTQSAWRDTTGFSTLLKFGATHQAVNNGDDRFSDWHTFYIRAVDNEYATSTIDRRFFNARTIAPTCEITFPKVPAGSIPTLVKTFVIEWEGEDLDSSNPEKIPSYFEYKLIRLANAYVTDAAAVDSLRVRENRFLDTLQAGDRTRWIRVPSTVRERVLRDLPDTQGEIFIFAVRAVDEAGATQPDLTSGTNWFKFNVQDKISKPNVVIAERTLGGHEFPRDGDVWGTPTPLEVPSNTPVRFQWAGDASYYGSKPGNVNYGLDVPDPEDDRYRDPRGIGGWIGWGKWTELSTPLIFPDTEDGQTHVFYLRMRDVSDQRSSERLCTVVMRVVAFRFARTALLVDDARITYGMTGATQDGVHDAFIDRFIGRIFHFASDGLERRSMYRPRTTGGGLLPEGGSPTDNETLPLSLMAQFSSIIWSFNFSGGETSGLWFHEHESSPTQRERRFLSSYVGAGGKLFLFGGRPLSAILSTTGGTAGGDYPKQPPQVGDSEQDFSEESFLWKFLHVRNQVVGIDPVKCNSQPPQDHQTWRDGLVACRSTNPLYPDLYVDPTKWDTEVLTDCTNPRPPVGGLRDFEGVLEGPANEPGFARHTPDAGLDTLYVGVPYNWIGTPPSRWEGMVTAQRYESTAADTLRGTVQGRVIMFLFQPYPFQEGPVVNAGTAAVNWLITGQDN